MKNFFAIIILVLSLNALNSYAGTLDCILVDGKAYPATEKASKFIKAVVNRNAVNCQSKSVLAALKIGGHKLNLQEATPAQEKIVRDAILKRREQRIKRRMRKTGASL